VLGLLTVLAYGGWYYGFGVLVDDISHTLGAGVGTLAIGFAIAQVLTGVLGLVAGRSLDRRGTRPVFVGGAVIGTSFLLLATTASDPWTFVACFGVGGGAVGAAGFYHLTQTVAGRIAPGSEARAIARLTIWGAFASPVLIPLTELTRSTFGWRVTLRLAAVAVGAVLLLAASVVDRAGDTAASRPSSSPLRAVRAAVGHARTRRLLWSSLAGSFGSAALLVLQVPVMVAAGLDRSTATTLAAARGLAQLLGRLPLGWLLRRHEARAVLFGARSLVAVGAVVLAVTTTPVVGVLFVLTAGAGIGAVSPLEGIYAREVLPADDLGTLMGALHLGTGLAAGLGPVVTGMVGDATGAIQIGLVPAAVLLAYGAWQLRSTPASGRALDATAV
jgi:MFS family permease